MRTRRHAAAAAESALLRAVVADDLATVRRELEQRTSMWAAEGGLSALHLAACFASPAVLAALLRERDVRIRLLGYQLQTDYATPDVFHALLETATKEQRPAFRIGATPLHVAVYLGNADAVRQLLDAGADPNAREFFGMTACHLATCAPMPLAVDPHGNRPAAGVKRRPPHAAPHPDIPELLLAAGGDIFSRTTGSQSSWVDSPLEALCDAGPDGNAASLAYLQHAAEQHAAGQWEPRMCDFTMQKLVHRALQIGARQFVAQFWRRVRSHDAIEQLRIFIEWGAAEQVQHLLQSGSVSAAARYLGRDMLTHALDSRQPAVAQLLVQHSAPVTMHALVAAVGRFSSQPAVLGMLLAAGPPPKPAPRPPQDELSRTTRSILGCDCPVEALLQWSAWENWQEALKEDPTSYRNTMVCMELMAEAGVDSHLRAHDDRPNTEYHQLKHRGLNWWLWRAYTRPPWTPATHQQFPPAFRAAARTLLLAARRLSRQSGHNTAEALGALPQDVLLHIIGSAAYPMTAWV